jgi:HK97 family phage major capsid protein
MTGSAGFSWIAEGDSSGKTATEPGFDQVALVPNQALMRTGITKQQLATSNEDVEAIVREDFLDSLAVGLDEAAISGSAGNDEVPEGVLSNAAVTGQTDLGVLQTLNFGSVVDLETSASANNAPDGRAGYLTTPQVVGLGKQTEKAATTAQFIVENGQINGFPVRSTTNVTSGISGSLGNDGHAIIFSPDWSQLIIADWGAIEILVDPFTLKHRGIVELNGTLLADVAIRHPEVFTVQAYDLG